MLQKLINFGYPKINSLRNILTLTEKLQYVNTVYYFSIEIIVYDMKMNNDDS